MRRNLLDYAGAKGRLPIERVKQLGSGFVVLEKVDGMYCHAHLDGRGRVERILSRTGEPVPRKLSAGLLGVLAGAPEAVLAGELEAHTEAGNRAAERRGWRNVHLFDCVRGPGGQYLGREPYQVRRDTLWRMQSEIATADNLSTRIDPEGNHHDVRSGKFCREPRDWRRFPILPALHGDEIDTTWQRAELGQCEGLVACSLKAPIGARTAKRKIKPLTSIDALVLSFDRKTVSMLWREAGVQFYVSRPSKLDLRPKRIAEVQHEGFYDDGTPRFARLVRMRGDLETA